MAQSLEKIFLQKVAQMPQEEVELPPPVPRSKNSRGRGRKSNSKLVCTVRLSSQNPFSYDYRKLHFSLVWMFIICACVHFIILHLNLSLSASGAQQVPAVSQSAYSPSSSDTGDSMLANSPQTVLTKSLPPANIMGLPPTQPTTKVPALKCTSGSNYAPFQGCHSGSLFSRNR